MAAIKYCGCLAEKAIDEIIIEDGMSAAILYGRGRTKTAC